MEQHRELGLQHPPGHLPNAQQLRPRSNLERPRRRCEYPAGELRVEEGGQTRQGHDMLHDGQVDRSNGEEGEEEQGARHCRGPLLRHEGDDYHGAESIPH